jgi:hypothetical protein
LGASNGLAWNSIRIVNLEVTIAVILLSQDTAYSSLDNAIALGTKRNPRRSSMLSWERWLDPTDVQSLDAARFKVTECEQLYENLQTSTAHYDLVVSRLLLERTVTRLMRVAVEKELDSNRGFAQDHTTAWKVFDAMKETPTGVPIPPATLVTHFETVMAPKNNIHAAVFPPFAPFQGPLTEDHAEYGRDFSVDELSAAVSKINMSSAPGPDGITPRIAKDLFSFRPFFLFFLIFVNYCLLTGWVPLAWRISEIFVLYKGKGDPTSADSYRGIALCSILAKVYERMLLNRLSKWWSRTHRSVASQFGFRLGSSTLDAVFVLRTLVNFVCKRHKLPLHAAFIDLRKAFPSVARGAMFERLRDIGVPTPLILAIRSFYMLNVSRLRIGSFLSRPFIVSLGLLEGSILSPLLFVIIFSFVWDLLKPSDFPTVDDRSKPSLNSLWILAFADDLVILSPSCDELERTLRLLDQEMGRFNLMMSLSKTEIMMFRHHVSVSPDPDPVTIRSNALKEVRFFKYLGVQVSQTGSLADHTTGVAQRARVSALMTVNLLLKLNIHSIPRLKCYFTSFVLSQFYALEMLPLSVLQEIEQVRNSFLRHMFKLPPGTPSDLFYVLFPTVTPAILCLRRRLALFRRCLRHNLKCVNSSFLLDVVDSYGMTCGWMHDSFLFYRVIVTSAQYSKFDFLEDVSKLVDVTSSDEAFSFEFVRHSSSSCMSFFQLVTSQAGFSSFRSALSRLDLPLQHVILSFSTSQMRWCFLSTPCRLCPLCFQKSWTWEHFIECTSIIPLLVSRNISLLQFKTEVRRTNWKNVFSAIGEVLLCWHFALESLLAHRSYSYAPDVFRSLFTVARSM